jgi:putative membrane protein
VIEMVMTILAEAGSHGGWGGGPWFLLFPLFWIALFVGAFFLFRRRSDRWQTHSAEGVLAERYAKGEISADEYQQRLGVLRRK